MNCMKKLIIDIPDDMAERIDEYLAKHPETTVYGLIKEALEIKLIPKDTSELLKLAGIVSDESADIS